MTRLWTVTTRLTDRGTRVAITLLHVPAARAFEALDVALGKVATDREGVEVVEVRVSEEDAGSAARWPQGEASDRELELLWPGRAEDR